MPMTQETPTYFAHERPEILPFVPDTIKVALDVGCAGGNFGVSLKRKFNCKVWGVEPNEAASAAAREKLDVVINDIFTDKLDFGGQQFDAIFFNDVLEHLVDPAQALAVARKLLNPKGCIIASMPNIMHFETLFKIIKERDW